MINRSFLKLVVESIQRQSCFVKFGNFRNHFKFVKESRAWDEEQQPCNEKLGFEHRSAKEPETPPAERALRIASVSKEPPAAREQGPRDQCKSPAGWAWNRVTALICLCPHLPKAGTLPARTTASEECENCTSSTTGRGTDRERCKESTSVGGTGRRSARSAQPGNPREPGTFYGDRSRLQGIR